MSTVSNTPDVIIYNDKFQNHLHKYTGTIISDPPYNIGFRYNTYKDNLPEPDYIAMIANFKNYPAVLIHYPVESRRLYDPAMGVPNQIVTWCYNSNLPRQSRHINFYNCQPDFEKVKQQYKNPNDKRIIKRIADGSSGARLYDWWSDINPVLNVSKEKTIHPCPVPVALMQRIIEITTNPGDLVIEPFLGSGTTALACLNTGRKCIGFEVDPIYYKEAKNRIAAHPKIQKPFIQAA